MIGRTYSIQLACNNNRILHAFMVTTRFKSVAIENQLISDEERLKNYHGYKESRFGREIWRTPRKENKNQGRGG